MSVEKRYLNVFATLKEMDYFNPSNNERNYKQLVFVDSYNTDICSNVNIALGYKNAREKVEKAAHNCISVIYQAVIDAGGDVGELVFKEPKRTGIFDLDYRHFDFSLMNSKLQGQQMLNDLRNGNCDVLKYGDNVILFEDLQSINGFGFSFDYELSPSAIEKLETCFQFLPVSPLFLSKEKKEFLRAMSQLSVGCCIVEVKDIE